MHTNDYHNKTIPCVIGLSETEARKRLLSAGALVACKTYSSKKGVVDADDIRVIRQRIDTTCEQLTIELIVSPCRVQI